MGVFIRTPQLSMEIRIVPTEQLYIHEETIPNALEQLKREILSDNILKHPMIVDSKTFVVLDGMHRVAALRSLGYHLAPVCLVDYLNPAIGLFSWYRELEGEKPIQELIDLAKSRLTFHSFSSPLRMAIKMVNAREALAALASKNKLFILKSATAHSAKQIYDEIARLEEAARQIGFNIIYSTESDAIKNLRSTSRFVMIVPPLTKDEVINAALHGELFAQKTTRHVVPARPLFINIPLEWLRESNFRVVDRRMERLLGAKRIDRLAPGAIIEGRRYEEYAYVFREP